jgi:hypothetical protein
MIEIIKAPPFATIQDRGRPGLRSQGVPVSGAMDVEAMVFANLRRKRAARGDRVGARRRTIRLTDTHVRRVRCDGGDELLDTPPAMTLLGEAGDQITLHVPSGASRTSRLAGSMFLRCWAAGARTSRAPSADTKGAGSRQATGSASAHR